MSRRAIFFDRDDTLMVNVPYCGDPAQVVVFPEAATELARLQQAGFLLFVVSNQSGVGRGMITREQVAAVTEEMHRQLGKNFFAGVYNSYAAPNASRATVATDRKPSPELLFRAATEEGLDLHQSVFIGDRLSDIQCGKNAGCATVLLRHPQASRAENSAEDSQAAALADVVVESLTQAVDWVLKQSDYLENL